MSLVAAGHRSLTRTNFSVFFSRMTKCDPERIGELCVDQRPEHGGDALAHDFAGRDLVERRLVLAAGPTVGALARTAVCT